MAKRGHAQYAAAAGDDIFVVELGSGVENFHAREVVGVGDPRDDFAFFVDSASLNSPLLFLILLHSLYRHSNI